jgi:hypothetical protein
MPQGDPEIFFSDSKTSADLQKPQRPRANRKSPQMRREAAPRERDFRA